MTIFGGMPKCYFLWHLNPYIGGNEEYGEHFFALYKKAEECEIIEPAKTTMTSKPDDTQYG